MPSLPKRNIVVLILVLIGLGYCIYGQDKDANPPDAQASYIISFGENTNDRATYRYVYSTDLAELFRELNRLGADGYRLVSANGRDEVYSGYAFLKLDETGRSFDYRGIVIGDLGQAEEILNSYTARGFYIKEIIRTRSGYSREGVTDPEKTDTENQITWLSNVIAAFPVDAIILERTGGQQTNIKYKVITAKRGLGKQPSRTLERQLSELEGFAPAFRLSALSDEALILRSTESESSEKTSYRVVRSSSAAGLVKKVNRSAEDGYRVVIFDPLTAVMKKASSIEPPAEYVLLNGTSKHFFDDLQKTKGSLVLSSAINSGYKAPFLKTGLLFSDTSQFSEQHKTYKIVKLVEYSLLYEKNGINELSSANEKMTEDVNKLLNEGYSFVTLINIPEVAALFVK